MIALQIIGLIIVGWLLGLATCLYLGARITRQAKAKRAAQIAQHPPANPLADPEVLAALEREIARVKGAVARGEPAHE
jgi:hypothetical protein